MRIRTYPAAGFGLITLAAAYLGLAPSSIPSYKQSDKVLHFVTFFLLTLCFYWILETNRRKNLQLTLFCCTFVLGVGSEVLQGLLPNGRDFDPFDIFANVLGSGAAVGINLWYHKRMLKRKRESKNYTYVGDGEDLELGEGVGPQESGTVGQTLEEEVENWDENDWDQDDAPVADGQPEGQKEPPPSSEEQPVEPAKRND